MWCGRLREHESAPAVAVGDADDGDDPGVTAVGDRVFLASVDHHPRWRIPTAISRPGRSATATTSSPSPRRWRCKATSGRGGSPVSADVRGPLGAVLHELFKNTHEWARTDETGVPLLRSVRGLLAQGHSGRRGSGGSAEGSPALGAYLASPGLPSPEGRLRFLELSVSTAGRASRAGGSPAARVVPSR